jgi:DNA-directed RNA polymerase alpha subunit
MTEEKLLACKNFGETSLNEVKQVLRRHGLTLAG